MSMGLVGCMTRHLLFDVEVGPSTISPNADGDSDVARIAYKLSRPAHISICFVDAQGQKHCFRQDNPRSPGSYEALFGGVIEGRMLPDGRYTYVVEAKDLAGKTERVEGEFNMVNADTTPPELDNFTVFPTTFTPNQDGISDRVAITFYLTKKATVEVYLLDDEGNRHPVGLPKSLRQPGESSQLSAQKAELEPGIIEYDYDAGVDLQNAPPPDGDYTVVAEAVDLVGNRVREERNLTIEGGGVPMAEIVNAAAEFTPLVVPLGEVLTFTATVENIGTVPIRTKGPAPGTTYTTSQNFNTLGFYEEPGVFRIGVDFEGNSQGRKYPYRWQLGSDEELTVRVINGREYLYLMPGQRVTVSGHIRIIDKPPKINPHYWAGLIHEQVRIVNDFIEPTEISVGF